MLSNYGYKDASGDFFITIDTAKCNGCGACADACPASIFAIAAEDANDPMRTEPVAAVARDKRTRLKYECNPCKPSLGRLSLLCLEACTAGAISHSW
jgi:Fe-S-cluster-containing hydrogenase component 2